MNEDHNDNEMSAPASEPAADPVRLIEALLFAAAEPIATQELYSRLPQGTDVGAALMQLKALYEGRGVALMQMGDCWAFRTAADLAPMLAQEKAVERKLSRAAMETLAIVAYHQPVTRAEIENIRGVATHKGTLDMLMELGWVKPGKRRETPGRPVTWLTTPAFLDHFALESTGDLPGMEDLRASGLMDRRPAIDAIPGAGDLFQGMADADAEAAEAAEDMDRMAEDYAGADNENDETDTHAKREVA